MAHRRTTEKKQWSYNAGRRGVNWVRCYQETDGSYYVEWMEPVLDDSTGLETRVPSEDGGRRRKTRRARAKLRDVTDVDEAKRRTDRIARRLGELASTEEPAAARTTNRAPGAGRDDGVRVGELLDRYLEVQTPLKGESKQDHDRRAARLFKQYFGDVTAEHLDRTHWDGFIAARSAGRLAGFGPVEPRQVEYDLKFLVAVLTWGLGATDQAGLTYLARNPWSAERRKATGMRMPRGGRPRRPPMTDGIRDGLLRHSPNPQFSAGLLVGRYTASRNSSVRNLRWADVDLSAGTIRWRGEFDKNQQEVVVPVGAEVVEALRSLPRGVGEAPVFPSSRNPAQPTPRNTWQTWLRRAKARYLESIADADQRRAVQAQLHRLGFHGEKRAAVRDTRFRGLPPKIQETIARTRYETLRRIYDDVGVEDMAAAMRAQGMLEMRAIDSQQLTGRIFSGNTRIPDTA